MKRRHSAGYWIIRIAVAALILLWMFVTDVIPWRFGTLKSIYGEHIGGEITYASLWYDDAEPQGDTPLFDYIKNEESIAKVFDYFSSLKLRPELLLIDNVKAELKHSLHFSGEDSTFFRIKILGPNLIEVSVSDLPRYRKNPYRFIIKDGLDIEYIKSCFEGGESFYAQPSQ